jgi:polar amino acid transport system substrate-binding protein
MKFRTLAARLFSVGLVAIVSTTTGGTIAAASSHGASVPSSWQNARKLVPASIRHNGIVGVATTASYPPYELYASNNETIIGVDPDLGKALGKILGLKFEFHNVTFGAIPTELSDGHYDLGMSAIGDLTSRQKILNFVDYASYGEAFLTPSGSSFKTRDLADVCGETIASQASTSESAQLANQNKICSNEGKKAINVLTYPSENTAVLAVHSGRAPALFTDLPTAIWVAKQSPGEYRVIPMHDPKMKGITGLYGIAFSKTSKLLKPVEAALKILIGNGTYKRIFTKWGVKRQMLRKVTINHAVTVTGG